MMGDKASFRERAPLIEPFHSYLHFCLLKWRQL